MIVASPRTRTTHQEALTAFLARFSQSIHAFDAPSARETTSKEFVINHFGYPQEDVESWLGTVTYPKTGVEVVERSTIEKTLKCVTLLDFMKSTLPSSQMLTNPLPQRTLEAAGVLEVPEVGWNMEEFVDTRIAKLV